MIRIKKTLKTASVLVAMLFLLGIISAQAANLTVTTTADAGFGSLRQAIIDATTNAAANVVSFNVPLTDPGYSAAQNSFTINLSTPLPDIPLAALTINNNQPQGVTLKGNGSFRILTLVNSAVLTITNLTIISRSPRPVTCAWERCIPTAPTRPSTASSTSSPKSAASSC